MKTIQTEICSSIYKLIYHGNKRICGWAQVLTQDNKVKGICPLCNARTVVLEMPTGQEER